MDNITFKKILDFLEKEENKISKIKGTLRWKLTFNEPIEKDDLIVKNDLDFGYMSNIPPLPDGLQVWDSLILTACTSLTSLPKGLKVGGGVNITDSSLTKYTEEELRKMIEPGFIKGDIIRYG